MKKVFPLAVLVALSFVFMNVSVMATPGLNVHIEVVNMFNQSGPFPFAASGPAVSAGLISATGFESTGPVITTPSPLGDPYLILSMTKYLTYGGGTLDIELVVTLNNDTGETRGNWKVIQATGNCAGIKGNGKLVGTRLPSGNGITDVWDGKLRVSPVLAVHIEAPTPLPAAPPIPFTASGAAVAQGLIGATGTVSTGPVTTTPSPLGDPYVILSMEKYFTCAGGSFDVKLVVTLDNSTGRTEGHWHVLGGTGICATLKGNGTLIGTYIPSTNTVFDVYDGKLKQ